jgi:hypothetical protein
MAMDSSRAINGSFGTVYIDGEWATNFNSGEIVTDITYEQVRRAGTRTLGNKPTDIAHSGTIRGYKVTSELAKKVAQIKDDTKGAYVTEIIMKLADPQAYGFERVRIKGVQFTRIDPIRFEHGSLVETEWPFVCDDWEFMDEITAE